MNIPLRVVLVRAQKENRRAVEKALIFKNTQVILNRMLIEIFGHKGQL